MPMPVAKAMPPITAMVSVDVNGVPSWIALIVQRVVAVAPMGVFADDDGVRRVFWLIVRRLVFDIGAGGQRRLHGRPRQTSPLAFSHEVRKAIEKRCGETCVAQPIGGFVVKGFAHVAMADEFQDGRFRKPCLPQRQQRLRVRRRVLVRRHAAIVEEPVDDGLRHLGFLECLHAVRVELETGARHVHEADDLCLLVAALRHLDDIEQRQRERGRGAVGAEAEQRPSEAAVEGQA